MNIQSAEVPFGTEVFIIVPDEHIATLNASKPRLMASLGERFPSFIFSLGAGVSERPEDFVVMTVAGKVGDGWKESKAIELLENHDEHAIREHLHKFVAGNVAAPN